MFKERFQEILEFTKSESPYSKANKGWINQDIFLEFGKSSSNLSKQQEAAKVTLLWPPIQSLIFNLLLIIVICSLLVLTTLRESKLKFNLGSLTIAFKNTIVQLENKESNLISEENQITDININSEIEDEALEEEINISTEELSNKQDLLKSNDNPTKDQVSELEEKKSEEKEIKIDISNINTKKSKSNFF